MRCLYMQDVKEDPDLMTDDDDDKEMEDLDALAKGMDRRHPAPLPKAASAVETITDIGTFCSSQHECTHLTCAPDLAHTVKSCICLCCCWHAGSSLCLQPACVFTVLALITTRRCTVTLISHYSCTLTAAAGICV